MSDFPKFPEIPRVQHGQAQVPILGLGSFIAEANAHLRSISDLVRGDEHEKAQREAGIERAIRKAWRRVSRRKA
jgi:hypothetical protein